MHVLLCVDDTDDLTKAISTGAIVSKITARLEEMGYTIVEGISRHQLLLSEDIAYTSHNSSMCAMLECETLDKQAIIQVARDIILEFKAEIADPGLALCWLDELQDPERLIEYGFIAKRHVVTKQEAYRLAAGDTGLFLEELGGTGVGVIGALAGLGLRLSRCDGTLRGKSGAKFQGQPMSVNQLCQKIKISSVLDEHGDILPGDATVLITDMVKRAYWEGNLIAWASKTSDGVYVMSSSHEDVEAYNVVQGLDCPAFEWDNDTEEMRGADAPGCLNCLYRRWLSEGYRCVKGLSKNATLQG